MTRWSPTYIGRCGPEGIVKTGLTSAGRLAAAVAPQNIQIGRRRIAAMIDGHGSVARPCADGRFSLRCRAFGCRARADGHGDDPRAVQRSRRRFRAFHRSHAYARRRAGQPALPVLPSNGPNHIRPSQARRYRLHTQDGQSPDADGIVRVGPGDDVRVVVTLPPAIGGTDPIVSVVSRLPAAYSMTFGSDTVQRDSRVEPLVAGRHRGAVYVYRPAGRWRNPHGRRSASWRARQFVDTGDVPPRHHRCNRPDRRRRASVVSGHGCARKCVNCVGVGSGRNRGTRPRADDARAGCRRVMARGGARHATPERLQYTATAIPQPSQH